jgi:hypothetical protein
MSIRSTFTPLSARLIALAMPPIPPPTTSAVAMLLMFSPLMLAGMRGNREIGKSEQWI